MNVIFHRGNTYKAVENSRESLDDDVGELNKYIDTPIKKSDLIFEVDVVIKQPFLIHHNIDDYASDVFINPDSLIDKKKKIWQLDDNDVRKYCHKSKNNHLLILSDLLEIARSNKIKLYLDIKTLKCSLFSCINNIKELYKLCDIIRLYEDVIDCIISFDIWASVLIKIMFVIKRIKKIELGMFCLKICNIVWMNRTIMTFIKFLLNPSLISYEFNLIKNDNYYLGPNFNTTSANKNKLNLRYVWTIHKTDLRKHADFFNENCLIPVVDMFDKIAQ
jgi:hypothetical protein